MVIINEIMYAEIYEFNFMMCSCTEINLALKQCVMIICFWIRLFQQTLNSLLPKSKPLSQLGQLAPNKMSQLLKKED